MLEVAGIGREAVLKGTYSNSGAGLGTLALSMTTAGQDGDEIVTQATYRLAITAGREIRALRTDLGFLTFSSLALK
jgi:hypothetical protein